MDETCLTIGEPLSMHWIQVCTLRSSPHHSHGKTLWQFPYPILRSLYLPLPLMNIAEKRILPSYLMISYIHIHARAEQEHRAPNHHHAGRHAVHPQPQITMPSERHQDAMRHAPMLTNQSNKVSVIRGPCLITTKIMIQHSAILIEH